MVDLTFSFIISLIVFHIDFSWIERNQYKAIYLESVAHNIIWVYIINPCSIHVILLIRSSTAKKNK